MLSINYAIYCSYREPQLIVLVRLSSCNDRMIFEVASHLYKISSFIGPVYFKPLLLWF